MPSKNKNSQRGEKTSKLGYIYIYAPRHPFAKKNYVLEHRLIVENKLGRYLKPTEVVHHINMIKNDNKIENLMLFKTQKEHMSFHRKIQQFGMTNPIKKQIKERWDKHLHLTTFHKT